jgi:hypothetical protein
MRCVAWRARKERERRGRGGDGTASRVLGKEGGRRGWAAVDGAGSPVPDPHGHTGPARASPRSGAVHRVIDGADCRQAWCVAWDRRHALVIVPRGRSPVFPFVRDVRGRCTAGPARTALLTPPGACNQTQHFHTNL